ncbi:MAG: hypothetical protein KAR42_14915 [candidate division Zixibacteria bacterium]|nr:hypothetical protein [candidate division Zixibacteria bacterium]
MTMSGIFGAPVENLATLLANCATFRTWVGAADVAAALTYIHKILDLETAEPQTKRAIITYMNGSWTADRQAMSSGPGSFDRDANLTLIFEKSSTDQHADIDTFITDVGLMINELMDKSGTDTFMIISGFNLEGFEYDFEGKSLVAPFQISWEM